MIRTVLIATLVAALAAGCGEGDEIYGDAGGDTATPGDTAPAPETRTDGRSPLDGGTRGDARADATVDGNPIVELDGGATDGPALFAGGEPFSMIVLPDTQFYAQSYPQLFEAQTRWIAAERERRQIAFVLHEGDIVETPTSTLEWTRADTAMRLLDGVVPYVLAAGNHDIEPSREAPLLNQRFPWSRFNPYFRGSYEPGKIQNAYYVIQAGRRDWLILSLEFGARDEVLAWADGVLRQHAAIPAILLTHAYMYRGPYRYNHRRTTPPMEYWNPHGNGLPGTTNDGEEMWEKLVSKHDNVLFVFSGHATHQAYIGAVGRLSTRRRSGAWVHEMLANYQGCPADSNQCTYEDVRRPVRGGEGFLRIVHVDPPLRRARVETYSPALDAWKPDPENAFELPLE